ncbi:hypothetical protein [Cryptosporangium sp. NPDC051539]|uniref:hypothetical protein n=1 Tax=Cryptosporangium sp. NPDC051539 TaxID=3363962 RepID=UPI0037B9B137
MAKKTVLLLTALGIAATAVAVFVARRREEQELLDSGVLPLEYGAEPILDSVSEER